MSGRRFEQLLRAFNCTKERENTDRLNKVSEVLRILIKNYQNAYSPNEALSLDESLLLHRGRLSSKQYIKGKKAKYGIKFFKLCSPNGYIHNIEIYKGKQAVHPETTKLHSLVFRLMEHFLDKGHHLVVDNYYNSVPLSNKLLQRKTHTTGTLRSHRRGNPKNVTSKKLNKGDHIWLRQRKVYVSKWKDKRDVLCITTKYHPKIIEVRNSYGEIQQKPREISEYNLNMSGVERADQLTSYYSSSRKSVRWYKKIVIHLLDITVINSFLLFREIHKNTKIKNIKLLEFRESLIRSLLDISPDMKDGRQLVRKGALNCSRSKRSTPSNETCPLEHILEKIPVPENYARKATS
ncbi:hypothetical protein NQ314_012418 [Rhamnusium bicolor]|uniref:PiggyBac transposable element-derived protein domain-containing protein n=1 Tax=Rhamnusium bicolor TaxID=1586634 RepID=A0AAV8XCF8_9CUCU|nr:hypothetical protein NQ314_012418 [Rhamnusium bicolor]